MTTLCPGCVAHVAKIDPLSDVFLPRPQVAMSDHGLVVIEYVPGADPVNLTHEPCRIAGHRMHRNGSAGSSDAVIQQLTARMSLLFLNAFVRDYRAALAEFLRSGEKAAADKIARWEVGQSAVPVR